MRAIIFAVLVLGLLGCSEISALRDRDAKLKELINSGATAPQLTQEMPLEWVRYEKDY